MGVVTDPTPAEGRLRSALRLDDSLRRSATLRVGLGQDFAGWSSRRRAVSVRLLGSGSRPQWRPHGLATGVFEFADCRP